MKIAKRGKHGIEEIVVDQLSKLRDEPNYRCLEDTDKKRCEQSVIREVLIIRGRVSKIMGVVDLCMYISIIITGLKMVPIPINEVNYTNAVDYGIVTGVICLIDFIIGSFIDDFESNRIQRVIPKIIQLWKDSLML